MAESGTRRDSIKVASFGGREYRLGSIVGKETEPTYEEVRAQMDHRPSLVDVKRNSLKRKSVSNREVTGASQITTRQSIIPICLVTTLFFLWGFAYGLLDVLYAPLSLNGGDGQFADWVVLPGTHIFKPH
jgi:hypothetical protein